MSVDTPLNIQSANLIFQPLAQLVICEGCGELFQKQRGQQVRCKKNCGRRFETKPVRFVGVDGEGLGMDPSRYVLLGVGEDQIEHPENLRWDVCFDFLYSRFKAEPKGTAFVGFFLGYDFTQIFKSLPEDRARLLLTREGKAKRKHRVKGKEPHPVTCGSWQFDILGNKRLRIRPKLCACRFSTCKCAHASWMYVCDVGPFWQTSFLNVINPRNWTHPVVTEEEYLIIKEGKERRQKAVLDFEMRYYNRLENVILARVMDALNQGFESIGVHLSAKQWFGPGQAAAKHLKDLMPKREVWEPCVDKGFLKAAQNSYFGGWFEILMHGIIPGRSYEYDINSAYPDVIRKLPCLLHGKYTSGKGLPRVKENDICYIKGRVYSTRNPGLGDNGQYRTGPMPHRDSDGSIKRPGITEGWYDWDEISASIRAGLCCRPVASDIYEWVKYEPCDCPPPFAEIESLYDKRLEVGKNTPLGKGSKLDYNSWYGKFAQSVGDSPFGCAVYAARTTSGCRRKILDAIATHPDGIDALEMVATDAVFFRSPHPGLPVSNKLGEWDYQERINLTLFKPGVYWDDETRKQIRERVKPKFKARGIDASQFAEEIWRIDYYFANMRWINPHRVEWPDALFTSSFSMVTALQALMWGKWHLAGTVRDAESLQSSDPSSKRGRAFWDEETSVWRTEIQWPVYDPKLDDFRCQSVPYRLSFGYDNPFSEESREAMGVTPDGLVADQFRVLLKNEE